MKQLKNATITVRLSKEENLLLTDIVEKQGRTKSDYMRFLLSEAIKKELNK